jgi:small-conductance mechanosensitive channel
MRRVILPYFLAFFSSSLFLSGQTAPPAEEVAEVETSPVMVDDMILFSVAGIRTYPAAERARQISERIKKIAGDPLFKTDSLAAADSEGVTTLMAGGKPIMRVFETDAALEAKGLSRQILVNLYLEKIKMAIEKYRRDREPDRLLRSGLTAGGATIGFIVGLFLFLLLFRRLMSLIESKTRAKILLLQSKSRDLLKAEKLGNVLAGILRVTRIILVFALAYVYLYFVLSLLPWTRLLSRRLADYVLNPLEKIGQAVVNFIPSLILIILIVVAARIGLKLVCSFFSGIEKKDIIIRGFDHDWAMPTYKIVRVLIIVLCAVVIFPYIPGTGSLAFKGISVFAGLLISLGASSAISNIIAGYTMTYRRAFRVGDLVRIGDYLGAVTAMRLLVTHLKTPKNEEVVVPNSLILSSQIVNFSTIAREKGLILHTGVTIGYDVPWRQVNALLLMAAERTPGVLREPRPFVFQKSLGDFYVEYELNAFTDNPPGMMQAYSDLHKNILDAFNEYGVQITSPNYENDPENLKIVPKERWYASPAKPPSDPEAGEKK